MNLTNTSRNSFISAFRKAILKFRLAYVRLMLRVSEKIIFEEFELYCLIAKERDKFFEETKNALIFLKDNDVEKFNKAKKYVNKIAYLSVGNNSYNSHLGMFIVDSYPEHNPLLYSSNIVHEAEHADLFSRGHEYNATTAHQHEIRCTEEQRKYVINAIQKSCPLDEAEKNKTITEWNQWFDEMIKTEWWTQKNIRARTNSRLRRLLGEFGKEFIKASKDKKV